MDLILLFSLSQHKQLPELPTSLVSGLEADLGLVADANKKAPLFMHLTVIHSFIISSLSLFILLFIFKPTLILSSTQVLSLTLFKL